MKMGKYEERQLKTEYEVSSARFVSPRAAGLSRFELQVTWKEENPLPGEQ